MQTDLVRHVNVIIVPDHIPVPDYFKAFYPALKDCDCYRLPDPLNEIALELTVNDTFYGTLYKHESGYYPELYIPLDDRPATFSVKGVRSGRHFRSVTVPQGTDSYDVVFCEGYPHVSDKGRKTPAQDSLELTEYDTTRLLLEALISDLQPDGETCRHMARPEVLFTRLECMDSGVYFHFITEAQNPAYIPNAMSRFVGFHTLNTANPQCTRTYIALNDKDCARLQQLAEPLLTESLQHLEFFTEDGCLCMRLK